MTIDGPETLSRKGRSRTHTDENNLVYYQHPTDNKLFVRDADLTIWTSRRNPNSKKPYRHMPVKLRYVGRRPYTLPCVGAGSLLVHRLIWECYNGKEIPEGHIIVHIDGERENFFPDNLLLQKYKGHIASKARRRKGYPAIGLRQNTHKIPRLHVTLKGPRHWRRREDEHGREYLRHPRNHTFLLRTNDYTPFRHDTHGLQRQEARQLKVSQTKEGTFIVSMGNNEGHFEMGRYVYECIEQTILNSHTLVRHIDGDKGNWSRNNLYIEDKLTTRAPKGEGSSNVTLTKKEAWKCCEWYHCDGLMLEEVKQRLEKRGKTISISGISLIVRGRNWREEVYIPFKAKHTLRPRNQRKRKLDDHAVLDLAKFKAKYRTSWSEVSIYAKKTYQADIQPSGVRAILSGRHRPELREQIAAILKSAPVGVKPTNRRGFAKHLEEGKTVQAYGKQHDLSKREAYELAKHFDIDA